MANGLLRMFADTKDEPAVVDADAAPDPAQRSFVHQNGAKPVADPWEGLGDEHLVQRSHCLILIKPQIALRSDLDDESVIILAAMSSDMEVRQTAPTQVRMLTATLTRAIFASIYLTDVQCPRQSRPGRSSERARAAKVRLCRYVRYARKKLG
jgi:hypothetical protein